MVRYDKIFSIIDIKEENMKKWGKCFHFYKNVQKEGGYSLEGSLKELARY